MKKELSKELRIGNLVLCEGGDIDTGQSVLVVGEVISLPMGLEAEYNIGAQCGLESFGCEGIALTEEHLTKAGFESYDEYEQWLSIEIGGGNFLNVHFETMVLPYQMQQGNLLI